MKNNINKKVGATLLAAAIMAGTAVIPMSNAAVEAAATKAAKATTKPSIEYRVQVQDRAWMPWVSEGEMAGTVGESRRMETLQVRMINCEGVSLKFYAHIQDLGDCYFTDKDEYVGTVAQSKRVEAIAITSEGLKEKGYKLQYRVQVQDKGWMPWVDDGEMAGTRYESKRLETIEIVVVPVDGDELAVEKAVAIDTLESYDASLKATQGASYEGIHTTIETAIKAINDATTSEEINKQYDAIVAEIKRIDNNIEENAVKNAEETEEAKVAARADIIAYKEAITQAKELTATDKSIINQLLENASKAIESAVTKTDVQGEQTDITNLMDASYTDVAVIKEQNQAIAKLNEYLVGANQGVKDVINKAISNIKEDVDPDDVRNELATVKGIIDPLKEAQEKYLNELDVYRRAVNASDVKNKTILINAIRRTETNVKNAKTAEEIYDDKGTANNTNDDTGIMVNFRAEFNDFEDKAKEILFNEAVEEAIETLTPYTKYVADKDVFVASAGNANVNSYKTVKKLAEETIERLEEMKEAGYLLGTNDADAVKEMVGKKDDPTTDVDEGSGVIDTLEGKIASFEQSEKLAKEAYQTARNIAVDALDKYVETVNGLELTEVQKADINSMISNTRRKVESVTSATEVSKAMTLLDNYMSKYFGADSSSEIQTTLIKKAKENAVKVLGEYQKSTISSIRLEAADYVQTIKNGIYANYVAVNDALDLYKITLDVKTAQFNATEKLLAYRSKAGIVQGTTIESYVDAQLAIINGASCTPADGTDTVATLKDKLGLVERTLTTATTAIKGALGVTAESEAKALQDAREVAYGVVNKYMALASEVHNTELVSDLADFNAQIRKETDVATINAMVAANGDVEDYIEKYYNVFYTQYQAINNSKDATITVNSTNVVPLAKMLDTKKNEADFIKYQAIAAEAEKNIKDLSKITKDDANEYAYIARMLTETATKVAELDAKVQAVKDYKAIKVTALKTLEATNASTDVATDTSAKENIYIERVNAVSLDDCTITKTSVANATPVTYAVTKCAKIDAIMKEAGDAFGMNYAETTSNGITTGAFTEKPSKTAINRAKTQLTATKGQADYVTAAEVNKAIKAELNAISAATDSNYQSVISNNVTVETLNKVKDSIIAQLKEYVKYNSEDAVAAKKQAVDNVNFGTITTSTTTDSLIEIALNAKTTIDNAK